MLMLFTRCGRAAPLFVPIFAPAMVSALPRLSDRVLGAKWVNIAAATVVLLGTIRIFAALPDNTCVEAWFNRRGPDFAGYPSAAAEFVAAKVPRKTGKLINEFDWGGYLAWKLPTWQVLLDGRTQLYTPAFWHELYLDNGRETKRALSTIEADAAIVPTNKSRFRDSLVELGWRQVFCDQRAMVFVPPVSIASLPR